MHFQFQFQSARLSTKKKSSKSMGLKSGTSTKSFQRFYVNCTDTNKKEIGVIRDKNQCR